MNDYIKYFENGGKNMSFLIKNSEVWEKYEDIWNVIKNKLKMNIKFHSQPIYGNKYLKAKVREFDGNIKANFKVIIYQKKIRIIHALREQKKLSTVLFRRMQVQSKENKYTKTYKH